MSKILQITEIDQQEFKYLLREVFNEILNEKNSETKNNCEKNLDHSKNYVSRKEILKILKKSSSWLNQKTKNGQIPYFKIGKNLFFDLDQIMEFSKISINNGRIENAKNNKYFFEIIIYNNLSYKRLEHSTFWILKKNFTTQIIKFSTLYLDDCFAGYGIQFLEFNNCIKKIIIKTQIIQVNMEMIRVR